MTESGEKPKRRLFRLLRRGRGAQGPERSPVEESALWAAHERAALAVRDSAESAARIATHVAKQRGLVDSLADRARGVSGRSADLAASFARLRDAFARLELVALNAGLEGARLGEGPGQALGLVSDEVRAQAVRGTEACRELGVSLGEIGGELLQVHESLGRARDASDELAQEAARSSGAAADAERALGDVGERLKASTGTDPETARAIAQAADHAKALVASLAALNGRAPQGTVINALRPLLEPLQRLLGDDEPGA